MRKRGGFLLVAVLLISIILITIGLAFLGKRAIQYRRAAQMEAASHARAMAEAGMEDLLIKFRRDPTFPPMTLDQDSFTYTEAVDYDGEIQGYYTVTVDGYYRDPPYMLWLVTSQGRAGADPRKPAATRTFRAEIDLAVLTRSGPTNFNGFYRAIRQFEDLGGI